MTVMIGIDPHKASHTAVAIDGDEVVISQTTVRATSGQTGRLRAWAATLDEPHEWAVESAAGLGYLVAQQLLAAGETVFDVTPMLASRVRVLGSGKSQKNDPNDARSVAIAAMRSNQIRLVVTEDHSMVLRLLVKRHRDMAQLRNKHCNRLHAVFLELRPGGITGKIVATQAIGVLDAVVAGDEVTRHRVLVAGELVDDIDRLDQSLKASRKRIVAAVAASGTTVTDIVGIGPVCAALILAHTGDITRFASKARYASYNATAPVEASSGGKSRHRLNQRGNRQLNFAIHIAAVSQLRYPGEGRTFYDRKIADGKSSKEAIRALKRRISDRVFRHLVADARRLQN